jgi:hypothetical protein
MGFSHEHRFKKVHDIHYSLKMNIKMLLDYTDTPEEVLQAVYDEEHKRSGRNAMAMNAVFAFLNRKQLLKNKSQEDTNGPDKHQL